VAPHREGLGAGPPHHACIRSAQFAGALHAVGIQIDVLENLGIAAGDAGYFVKTEIQRRAHIAGMPFADIAQAVAGVAQALRIQNHIPIHVAVDGRRRMDLVIDAVMPVERAAEQHGARRATHGGRRVAALKEHALFCQPIQIRRAAKGASGDGRPLLLVGHDVQNVRARGARRLRGYLGGSGGAGEKGAASNGP